MDMATFLAPFNFVIADDDHDDQLMLQKAIWGNNAHHKITSVYNGKQLIQFLSGEGAYKNCIEPHPDCIFLDLNMPLISGPEALKQIRSKPALDNIKIYIISTANNAAEKEKLKMLGVNGFIVKEADEEKLQLAINVILLNLLRVSYNP
jgi:two-component system, response regulator